MHLKQYQPISACAIPAGLHGPKLFANLYIFCILPHNSDFFMTLKRKPFEKIVRKGNPWGGVVCPGQSTQIPENQVPELFEKLWHICIYIVLTKNVCNHLLDIHFYNFMPYTEKKPNPQNKCFSRDQHF